MMAENSKIEWTDATVNFWWGCTKVGPGCDHCYAEKWSERFGGGIWGVGATRRKIKSAVKLIYRLHNDYSWWAADAQIGKLHPNSRRRVFVQSMSDLFDVEVPLDWFAEAWQHLCACDRLEIQIVTKRIRHVARRLEAIGAKGWPKHAGLIISVVNQEEADRDVPVLLALKAMALIPWIGLSMEPLLGGVVLRDEWLAALDWIIVGGESGPGARPMHPDWARSLRDQCAAAGVPFLFKQWGEWAPANPWYEDHSVSLPLRGWGPEGWTDDGLILSRDSDYVARLGKRRAGRLLDGVEHNGFPATRNERLAA